MQNSKERCCSHSHTRTVWGKIHMHYTYTKSCFFHILKKLSCTYYMFPSKTNAFILSKCEIMHIGNEWPIGKEHKYFRKYSILRHHIRTCWRGFLILSFGVLIRFLGSPVWILPNFSKPVGKVSSCKERSMPKQKTNCILITLYSYLVAIGNTCN